MHPSLLHSLRAILFALAVCLLAALPGCATSPKQAEDSPKPEEEAAPVELAIDSNDAEMKPDRVMAKCAKLGSGGNYVTEGKGMSFYLDRDSTGDSIRKVQELLASSDYKLR